jgi:predicted small secreted protein
MESPISGIGKSYHLAMAPDWGVVWAMKKIHLSLNRSFFILALACTALVGCATSPGTAQNIKGGGRLIIVRSANMGEDLAVSLTIDGVHVTDIEFNRTYDAPLAEGQHVLSVVSMPRQIGAPTQTRLMVKKGQTYRFTAVWNGQRLTLQRTAP